MTSDSVLYSRFELGRDVDRFDRRACELPERIDEIVVHPENPYYYSKGNCLIDRRTGDVCLGCHCSVIPDDGSVTGIADFAFYACEGLRRIVFPESIRRIGAYAFFGCSDLEHVVLPPRLRVVKLFAFANCRSLFSAALPDGVQTIEERAFSYDPSLTFVKFCGEVPEQIDDSAFKACGEIRFRFDESIPQNRERVERVLLGLRFFNTLMDMLNKRFAEPDEGPPRKEE